LQPSETDRFAGATTPRLTRFSHTFKPFMHYDAHQPIIDDLEARITTIRDSL